MFPPQPYFDRMFPDSLSFCHHMKFSVAFVPFYIFSQMAFFL